VLENLKNLADFPIETLHIIGGGSQNNMLNRFTSNAIGMAVIAGPSEATAIGNILLQAKAFGLTSDKNDMRKMVRNSVDLVKFEPQDTSLWNKKYTEYLNVFKEL
jgi:rhamnulokinase